MISIIRVVTECDGVVTNIDTAMVIREYNELIPKEWLINVG